MPTYSDQECLDKFNEEHNCHLKFGRRLGSGLTGTVYEVYESSGFWSRLFSNTLNSPFMKYNKNGMVMKIMRTDKDYSKQLGAGNPLAVREDFYRRHYREINLMEKVADCEYTMPLIGHMVINKNNANCEHIFLLLMPQMVSFEDYFGLKVDEEGNALEPMLEADLIQLAQDISNALAFCHSLKILHQDVKPDNIFVQPLPNNRIRFILGDFGFSQCFDANWRESNIHVYNRKYTPPKERINFDQYTIDVYGLGQILKNFAPARTANNSNPQDLSPSFKKFIEKAIDPEPNNRYQNGGEMVKALENLDKQEKRSGTVLSYNRNYKRAIDEVKKGNYGKALVYAEAGMEKEEPGCRLLALYCRCRDYGKTRDHIMYDVLNEALTDLIFEKDGEPEGAAALCVRGMLALYTDNGLHNFEEDIREAAQKGFAPAQYYYGKAMFTGLIPGGSVGGMEYLEKAVCKGHWLAIEYVRSLPDSLLTIVVRSRLRQLDQEARAYPADAGLWAFRQKRDAFVGYL